MSHLHYEDEADGEFWGSGLERVGSSWTTGKTGHFPFGIFPSPGQTLRHKWWTRACAAALEPTTLSEPPGDPILLLEPPKAA